MKVLIVCSGNKNVISPFILEQANELIKKDIEVVYYFIKGKGFLGYIKNIFKLKKHLKLIQADLIHAHYGLSALICVFQRKIPVVVTYHGSDINVPKLLFLSKIAMKFSKVNIFVSKELAKKSGLKNTHVLPCGVDFETFHPFDKMEARKKLNLNLDQKIILFASDFNTEVKNSILAKNAIALLNDDSIKLFELKGYSREEVALLLNAADVALLTSTQEGSPQFIKEAMACNCPIVSTDVGDIRQNIEQIEGCFITSFSDEDVSRKLKLALNCGRTNGRDFVREFDNREIAEKLIQLYKTVL